MNKPCGSNLYLIPKFVLKLGENPIDSGRILTQIVFSFESTGSLAQLVEHFTFNEGVDGSNPSRATILKEFLSEGSHRLVA